MNGDRLEMWLDRSGSSGAAATLELGDPGSLTQPEVRRPRRSLARDALAGIHCAKRALDGPVASGEGAAERTGRAWSPRALGGEQEALISA